MAPKAMKWQSGDQVTRDPSKAFEWINLKRTVLINRLYNL